MRNIFVNKLALFYLAVALILLGIIVVIVVTLTLPASTPQSTTPSPTPLIPTPTLLPAPILRSTIAPSKQGVFSVIFAKAPDPSALTITLASSTLNPSSPTTSVPFASSFQNEGKLLVITTTQPLQNNVIYTLYVRLKSNNHIVVKHRYQSTNGSLTILDNG